MKNNTIEKDNFCYMWDKVKKLESLKNDTWIVDFTEALKKMKDREKYDEVWQKIKKKNNW